MDYIARNLEKCILELAKTLSVIVVIGPAKAGKTTMLRHLMEGTSRSYVSLEDMEERSLAATDPQRFLKLHRPPVFIDDIFYAPELAVHLMDEAERFGKPGDYWLAGAQNEAADPEIKETFNRRAAVLNLTSLAQAEICGNRLEPFYIERRSLSVRGNERIPADKAGIMERIVKGSMPAVISGRETDRRAYYSRYISRSIIPELQDYFEAADSIKLYQLLKSCAARCSQLLNVAQMAKETGLNQRQTNDYLSVLGQMGVVFFLRPYANENLKRMVKTPKLYFYDTGLLCHLLQIQDAQTLDADLGLEAILESYCMSEIMKSYLNNGLEPSACYYRNKDSKEVHLLIRSGDYMQPVMFSASRKPDPDLVRLFEVPERAGVPCQSGAVICLSPDFSLIDHGRFCIPAWAL